jgi:hypothetical protein
MLVGCAQQAPVDLAASLKGIAKSKFLTCSGPPLMEFAQSGQDRMSFVTNLKRGQAIGIESPTAFAPDSCSVDAVFEQDRLTSSSFSGNLSMCQLVFSPCLGN